MRKLSASSLLALLLASTVCAVSPSGGEGISTTSWDTEVTAWDFVGVVGGASGVYLGNYNGGYWVATAAHVSIGALNFGGYSYDFLAGSLVTMNNPAGTYTPDLVLFQISSENGDALHHLDSLGNLAFDTEGIGIGVDVRLVGNGGGKSWGDNTLAGTGEYEIGTSGYGGLGYYTLDEQGVAVIGGDSGGGMFYQDDEGDWVLAGILSAKGGVDDPITGAFAISLAAYSDQILAVIPEPATWANLLGGVALIGAWLSRRRP